MDAASTEEPPRIIYLIDQFKNPAEVEFFRRVYKNIFYLVGVLSSQESRVRQLESADFTQAAAYELIERDREENIKHGQRLEKTIQKSDYFIGFNPPSNETLNKACERFVRETSSRKKWTNPNSRRVRNVCSLLSLTELCVLKPPSGRSYFRPKREYNILRVE